MTIFQFMSDSPWLTLFIVYVASHCIFRIWNRTMRMLNIRKNGWPPPHCDADGDFKPKEESKTP